jgi:hypothetical protein
MEAAANAKDARITPPPPALVAAAGWAVPGLGYWFVGQRSRGIVIGVTVVALFVLGLLIGGVRVLEVPTFSRFGDSVPAGRDTTPQYIWREVQTKPWSVPQIMAGPIAIAGGAASVRASRVPDEPPGARPPGAESHARINEIAVLYTAVAGMLNLLAMIDAAHRAHKLLEGK